MQRTDLATVAAVDPAARTIVLTVRGASLPACRIGRGVRHWRDLVSGDRIRATIREVLTVYVAPANDRGANGWARSLTPDARVLISDPSYRVLTVQYPNGETEAFKIGLPTRMTDIEAGDSVSLRPVEVLELRLRRHPARERISRPSPGAAWTR